MSKILEEKKERKKRILKQSITIKKHRNSSLLKANKESDMDSSTDETKLNDVTSPDANADLRTLILSIKKTQCTKNDMKLLTDTVNSKLVKIESKITTQDGKIDAMNQRLNECEKQAASAQYHNELEKQRSLKTNLSIFGVDRVDGENLTQIAMSIFSKIDCQVDGNQILNCYRINGNSNNIIIVKLSDFELKQKILKAKSKKPVKAGDVTNCSSAAADSVIYINNHTTPYFGKLLQEGRKAVKLGKMHSCWLNSFGCQMKFDENGKHYGFRTIDELNGLLLNKPKSKKRLTPDDGSTESNSNKITRTRK